MPVKVRCAECDSELKRPPYKVQKSDRFFCDKRCMGDFMLEGEMIEKECHGCDGLFKVPESNANKNSFCSNDCAIEHGLECPHSQCDRDGFKNRQGVKMHYTRTHEGRYDVVRLKEKYGVPINWLIPTLHNTLDVPIKDIAERLDLGRRWIYDRMDEWGEPTWDKDDVAIHNSGQQNWNWRGGRSLIDAVRKEIGDEPWSSTSRRIRKVADGCKMCGSCVAEPERLDVHHIIAINAGGTNGDWNLMPLCNTCHQNVEHYTNSITEAVLVE